MAVKSKKTDRRAVYTRRAIGEALLDLLAAAEFSELTVTRLCRAAELSRGTFYLHYANLREVIDELYDEALDRSGALSGELSDWEDGSPLLRLCSWLRENRRYMPLFLPPPMQQFALDRILSSAACAELLSGFESSGISKSVVHTLVCHQFAGCMAMLSRNQTAPDKEWEAVINAIERIRKNGIAALADRVG